MVLRTIRCAFPFSPAISRVYTSDSTSYAKSSKILDRIVLPSLPFQHAQSLIDGNFETNTIDETAFDASVVFNNVLVSS